MYDPYIDLNNNLIIFFLYYKFLIFFYKPIISKKLEDVKFLFK